MVKRKDDGTQSGPDDKAQAETDEGTPVESDQPSRHPADDRIGNAAGDDEGRAAPVADEAPEGGDAAAGSDDDSRARGAGKAAAGVTLFATSSATSAAAAGTPGDDFLVGTSRDDTIDGGAGNDTISGGSGNDSILGGPGTDLVFGEAGNDTILGGPDSDVISGGSGDDEIDGGPGSDLLFGDNGEDTIRGGDGNDTIEGGNGNDEIHGGGGENLLEGGNGTDSFFVSTPGDTVDGGNGQDTLNISAALGPLEINRDPDDSTSGTINFDSGGNVTFRDIENIVPCFTPGTRIATPRGECAVEALRVGDRVITRDNGLQEIRWIGQRALTGEEMRKAPHLRPIMIRAGALGRGLPLHDMLVSPQHRMLLNSERAALYFEDREVLASARHLTGMDGVDLAAAQQTTYVHFMFDQHEVVLSNGAWSESFQPGAQVLDGLGEAQRDEIFELFPDLRDTQGIEGYQAARRSLKKHEARLLVG